MVGAHPVVAPFHMVEQHHAQAFGKPNPVLPPLGVERPLHPVRQVAGLAVDRQRAKQGGGEQSVADRVRLSSDLLVSPHMPIPERKRISGAELLPRTARRNDTTHSRIAVLPSDEPSDRIVQINPAGEHTVGHDDHRVEAVDRPVLGPRFVPDQPHQVRHRGAAGRRRGPGALPVVVERAVHGRDGFGRNTVVPKHPQRVPDLRLRLEEREPQAHGVGRRQAGEQGREYQQGGASESGDHGYDRSTDPPRWQGNSSNPPTGGTRGGARRQSDLTVSFDNELVSNKSCV